jgi:hypothetical protein
LNFESKGRMYTRILHRNSGECSCTSHTRATKPIDRQGRTHSPRMSTSAHERLCGCNLNNINALTSMGPHRSSQSIWLRLSPYVSCETLINHPELLSNTPLYLILLAVYNVSTESLIFTINCYSPLSIFNLSLRTCDIYHHHCQHRWLDFWFIADKEKGKLPLLQAMLAYRVERHRGCHIV